MIKFVWKVKRKCRYCGISNNDLQFWKGKDTRSGKRYVHNICVPCKKEKAHLVRIKYYYRNRQKQIIQAAKWNRKNREKYNARRRKANFEKRLKDLVKYNIPLFSKYIREI